MVRYPRKVGVTLFVSEEVVARLQIAHARNQAAEPEDGASVSTLVESIVWEWLAEGAGVTKAEVTKAVRAWRAREARAIGTVA